MFIFKMKKICKNETQLPGNVSSEKKKIACPNKIKKLDKDTRYNN